MITINLLPEEFRVKEKTAVKLPYRKLVVAAGVLFTLLTGTFYLDYRAAKAEWRRTDALWRERQPQATVLKQLEQEVGETLKPEKEFLAAFVSTEKPLTNFLMWLSESLPDMAWLTEIRLKRKGESGELFVKGLALPTREKSSIEQIESYLNALKARMPEANLSLTTTRQDIQGHELTQFIASFDWSGPGQGS